LLTAAPEKKKQMELELRKVLHEMKKPLHQLKKVLHQLRRRYIS